MTSYRITSIFYLFMFNLLNISIVRPKLISHCQLQKGPTNSTDDAISQKLLKKLENLNFLGEKYQVTDSKYKYNFSVCTDVNGKYPKSALIQSTSEGSTVLGRYNQTKIIGGSEWVLLTFMEGEKYDNYSCKGMARQASVLIHCSHEPKSEFTFKYESMLYCTYIFELKDERMCLQHPSTGMSGGGIFLLLLFIAFMCYFIVGCLYRRLVVGAKGFEQIPNRMFWIKIGDCFADGCNALCRCEQYCGRGEASSINSPYSDYSPIGGEGPPPPPILNVDQDSTLLPP